MRTYSARIVGVIDGHTVDVEIDLGFHIQTKVRITLMGVSAPGVHSQAGREAAYEVKEWIWEHVDGSPWPLTLTTRRLAWLDQGEARERYVGTVTTPDGASLNEHMIRWTSDNQERLT